MGTASELLAVLMPEEGYIEKASNRYLDDKTANAGRNNWTKYARDLDRIPGFYNGAKNGYPWCTMFTDWGFVKAFGVDEAKRMMCHSIYGAGCTTDARQYRAAGRWTSSPQVGDVIFFGDVGDEYHTGVVYDVDDTYVYTIEGNTSPSSGVVDNGGEVCRKRYRLGAPYITGYGRPYYDGVQTPENKGDEIPEQEDEVKLPMIQRGSVGSAVKSAQILLNGYGFDVGVYGADGDFGSDTEAATIAYQRANDLDADGIIGPMTWSKLLGV